MIFKFLQRGWSLELQIKHSISAYVLQWRIISSQHWIWLIYIAVLIINKHDSYRSIFILHSIIFIHVNWWICFNKFLWWLISHLQWRLRPLRNSHHLVHWLYQSCTWSCWRKLLYSSLCIPWHFLIAVPVATSISLFHFFKIIN